MSSIVLDASAILAVANKEPGAAAVLEHRSDAIISAVNHAEVISKLVRSGIPFDSVQHFLNEVFPRVIPFDQEQASEAGRLHAATRAHELSYADCACIVLGMLRLVPVLTGDREWLKLNSGAEIRAFR